ncbi:photosystem I assembly protein Ycf4 [Cyanobacterium aponinum UTEX 3222]|uniref:Photosystem I assembly protein Ycf4 n=3 Tax=Cyanobacterium aponinum TaxID=379064 RepID=K9Z8S0_CYAAP|nr:photosystem I assembly protein Ycf4 [Cyanobacterium aponinum]WRL43265.1 photosystem I assembly protein Ycf4 [Cyanobacterium aponinum UTEX 3222]AFZ54753.1 Photosystem I assembly protein ycf4 [Cyanobacterium aponinum PCC 10605]MBD2392662.1 photosystem I assembly protein Ycf4 [Cyanobacterium aponinum FACHB-4101]MTF38300.1 photosystem I assembly protein Ycf4 [Cyanobacterium aponinum 0216]PHV64018.1 photosystem I assembly protein Ycf4 [Cyanobacterium aponinum IPPAS B-1201]
MTANNFIYKQQIIGSRRFSNYFWAIAVSFGGVGFLLAGLSSYLHTNLLIVSDTSELQFIPQGIALTFYGVAGTLLASYLWLMIILNVGSGYNEFDKKKGKVTIYRQGFLGKNRKIELVYDIDDIQAIRAEIKEGLNPKRVLYLRVKPKRDIPLTSVGEPMPLSQLENQGAELARFLTVPLEGL